MFPPTGRARAPPVGWHGTPAKLPGMAGGRKWEIGCANLHPAARAKAAKGAKLATADKTGNAFAPLAAFARHPPGWFRRAEFICG